MFQKLVSHNGDLRRLVEKGYAVGFDSNHLIVRDIPYLDTEGSLQIGTIVAKLEFVDQERVIQTDHQIFFAGSAPCELNGQPIRNLGGGQTQVNLSEACRDVVVQRSFSNKPKGTGKFKDFYEKIESYVGIISGPAIELHGVNPLTFRTTEESVTDSVFKFRDTLTSLAEIGDLIGCFHNDVVAIIGLGGTGSYVLDFMVKTPVREIRAFDHDHYHVHNAFRSPGRLEEGELGRRKAEVYSNRYDNFRRGLISKSLLVDRAAVDELEGVTFAFVCVDKGAARADIFELLFSEKIPFIDVGMGLNRKHSTLNGLLRVTYYSAEDGEDARVRALVPLGDGDDDVYRANVQISELNSLNACLAVIRFKQLRGFYSQEDDVRHILFEIGDLGIARE